MKHISDPSRTMRLRKMFEGFRVMAKDPQAIAQFNKGCTRGSSRDGASMSMYRDCDKRVGAAFNSHMRVFGTIDEIHQHSEVTLDGIGADGGDKTVIADLKVTYIGQCPSNVKPGQSVIADGMALDPFGDLERRGGEAADPNGAGAPK